MVINNTWELAPWADVLYAGARQWWMRYGSQVRGWAGVKYTGDVRAAGQYGCRFVRRVPGEGLCTKINAVHPGGNSGYQAVNLAWHLGAKQIVLLGFDMHRRNGAHWHGEHVHMLSAPQAHIQQWVKLFRPLAKDLKERGVSLINATPSSDLDCIDSLPLDQAIAPRAVA